MSVTLTTPPQLRTTSSDPASVVRSLLSRLHSDLPAFVPAAVTGTDARTAAEIHAAARAAACPDLFIVSAPDPFAGERVVSEIARATDGRVLILSPNPAAADRITERLAAVGVVRALADDENPIRSSPIVAKLTSAALGPGRIEQLRQDARTAIDQARAQLSALDRLSELCPRLAALEEDLAELRVRRDRAEEDARAATDRDTVARTVRLRAAQENPQPFWMADVEQLSTVRQMKHAALAEIRQRHGDSSARPGFFARLLGRSKPSSTLEADRREQTLAEEISAIDARLAESQAVFEMQTIAEWERVVREKAAALLAQTDQRVAELTSLCNQARAEVESVARPFGSVVPPAGEWSAIRAEADRQLVDAHNRLDELDSPELCRQLLSSTRVVVGTPGSLHADAVFEPSMMVEPSFALLVLDRCEDLTEPDFLRLARLAARWVLVGDAQGEPRPTLNGIPARSGRNGRPVEMPFAVKLARMLERQPWTLDAGRLICRLVHTGPDDRCRMTCEPLIDRPEIELHFTTDSDGEPLLARVAFPSTMTVAEAKSFLFQELGAVLLRPAGEMCWEESPGALTACWPVAAAGDGVWIDLETGVREKIAGAGLAVFTAAVAFDPALGWDRVRAEAWLAERLATESNCRLAVVPAEKSR